MQRPVNYDLSGLPVHLLLINNTYDDSKKAESVLPPLPHRRHNDALMIKTLCFNHSRGPERSTAFRVCQGSNLTVEKMRKKVASFMRQVEEAVKKDGAAVTLFHFSGYGTRLEADTDEAVLCSADHGPSMKRESFRILHDYLHPLSDVPGMHMLLLDCCHLNSSPYFPFMLPNLPPRFHALYTNDSQQGDPTTLTSPLTDTWCKQLYTHCVEDHSKLVRISLQSALPTPFFAYECSTLHNHYSFIIG